MFNNKFNSIKMKTNTRNLVISSLMVASIVLASSCQKDAMNTANPQYASVLDVQADGTSTVVEVNLKSAFIETAVLTDSELASLLKMKEEEKLARDVYEVLYQKWGSQLFSNITVAENNHLNAIVLLLENYGATETTVGEAGKFTNAEVQTLYNKLVASGTVSIEEAYKTGSLIEEMDIKDMTVALSGTTNENVIMVFENLYRGSRNHLRAFSRQLISFGIVFTPVYISQSDYDLIVNSTMEKGKQYRMNGQGIGKKGQGKNGSGSCNN